MGNSSLQNNHNTDFRIGSIRYTTRESLGDKWALCNGDPLVGSEVNGERAIAEERCWGDVFTPPTELILNGSTYYLGPYERFYNPTDNCFYTVYKYADGGVYAIKIYKLTEYGENIELFSGINPLLEYGDWYTSISCCLLSKRGEILIHYTDPGSDHAFISFNIDTRSFGSIGYLADCCWPLIGGGNYIIGNSYSDLGGLIVMDYQGTEIDRSHVTSTGYEPSNEFDYFQIHNYIEIGNYLYIFVSSDYHYGGTYWTYAFESFIMKFNMTTGSFEIGEKGVFSVLERYSASCSREDTINLDNSYHTDDNNTYLLQFGDFVISHYDHYGENVYLLSYSYKLRNNDDTTQSMYLSKGGYKTRYVLLEFDDSGNATIKDSAGSDSPRTIVGLSDNFGTYLLQLPVDRQVFTDDSNWLVNADPHDVTIGGICNSSGDSLKLFEPGARYTSMNYLISSKNNMPLLINDKLIINRLPLVESDDGFAFMKIKD